MLTESFIAATSAANKAPQHLSAALKDVGIFIHEFQPHQALSQGFKKSSVQPWCLAVSSSHIFAAQAEKAVINVYSREKGNQEATVPFPERIRSLAFAEDLSVLVIGTEEGKMILWEVATGRLSSSTGSHLQGISSLCITPHNDYILSGSADATVFVWSMPALLAFPSPSGSYSNDSPANGPVGTFSGHRNPITALSCGHSRPNTNFAVSASDDKTCHVWHIETCQIIRTVLLLSTPVCAVLDPVDRAVYFGDEEGAVVSVDLLSLAVNDQKRKNSTQGMPVQALPKDAWRPSTQLGTAHCVTMSYDGTSILSGHANGAIVQWDVAKRKMVNEVTNIGQPITCIEMLSPEGLHHKQQSTYLLSAVVKPKLEFNTLGNNGSCGIPPTYNLNVTLTGTSHLKDDDSFGDDLRAIVSDGWPESMLDDAIHALEVESSDIVKGHDSNLARAERLEDEVTYLKERLAVLNRLEQKRGGRKADKLARLEEVGSKRRQAYFEAKKLGKDGDAAMKHFGDELARIEAEDTDAEEEDAMDMT